MMMTIALRFIPTLMEEADRIMKAQSARGASFDEGGLIKRAKSVIPCWCRFSSLPSAGPRSWQWPWRCGAITAARGARACMCCALRAATQ